MLGKVKALLLGTGYVCVSDVGRLGQETLGHTVTDSMHVVTSVIMKWNVNCVVTVTVTASC